MRLLLTTLLCLCFGIPVMISQKLEHRLGYLIVQLEKRSTPSPILSDYSRNLRSEITVDRTLSNKLGIYLIKFDHSLIHQGEFLDALREDHRVSIAQYDHITTLRAIPNDPEFPSQWQWLNTGQTGGINDADIDAEKAWDISTGGLTALGDTIVVAIIDDGLDYNHVDIQANAWINYNEIDGNGIDDDNNGYIDDIHGWNAYDQNGEVFGNNHGLNVAGMIGAKGNNSIGITGINWNVKIMMIVGGSPESSAIASYAYALDQRELYEQTHGEFGAFVVATNSSWGIDFGQPSDAPLWCAFYDSLGLHGILSAGATANNSVDIDIVGDLPTACPSEYLLSVTALNAENQRTFSAWGATQVDFGAPGEDIYTTKRNNLYGTTSGTSFASPIAAGVVGLLYSAPCESFAQLAHNNPAAAAAYIRDIIFMGVKPIPGLESTIRFGGSINAGNSMQLMMVLCSACPIPFAIQSTDVTDVDATLTWTMVDTADVVNARIKQVAAGLWDTLENVSSPLALHNLIGCTEYEIEFESICNDTSTGYQSNYHFSTEGCCELPDEFLVDVAGTNIELNWTSVLGADYYIIEYRPEGETDWIQEAVGDNSFIIEDLNPCSFYEVRLQTSCDTTETGFTEIDTVRTQGCGNCIDLEYCNNVSNDASGEYIDSLIIGPLENPSGSNNGYAFFDSLDLVYIAGETYPFWLRPGFTAGTFDEQIRLWIDLNQDGTFDETELLIDSVLVEEEFFLSSSITIPEGTPVGSTRMRVSMAYVNPFFPTDQDPCGVIEFGEVEDYCITIINRPPECPKVDTVFFDGITFTDAYMYWPAAYGAIAYTYRYREVGELDYKEFATVDTTANLTGLSKCKDYEVQIRTICTFDTTSYATNYILKTDCDVAVQDPSSWLASLTVFPNPTSGVAFVSMIPLETGRHSISVYSMQGQRLDYQTVVGTANQPLTITLNAIQQLRQGLYFIVIEKGNKRTAQKLIRL